MSGFRDVITTVFRGIFPFFFFFDRLISNPKNKYARLILILPTLKFGGKSIPAIPFIQY